MKSMPSEEEPKSGETNYFWVTASPDIWKVPELEEGDTKFYAAYNKKGNKKRLFDAFQKASPGDKVVFYQSTPVKKIVGQGEIEKGLHEGKYEDHEDTRKGILIKYFNPINGISWSELNAVPKLGSSQPMKNRSQGSIFELTEKEYETILALEEEPEAKEEKQDIIRKKNNSELEFTDIDIVKNLYFPGEMEEEINESVKAALRSGKNIIFTGPPGTGKTKLAKNVADEISEKNGAVDGFIFTTATADWTTFDTIGGYHPEKESGSLEFKPGQFLKCFKNKEGRPINKWLIIDEINRADIDKAFGQLFSVLSNDSVELPFTDVEGNNISIKPLEEEISEEEFDYSDSDYYATRNWRLLATMNTYDKTSLYEMSYAFMRRFAFVDVGVPTEEVDEDLLGDYIDQWDKVYDEEIDDATKESIVGLWTTLNEDKRAIGPAIIRDMLLFLQESETVDLISAMKLYVLPQLEGMVKDDQKNLIEDLGEEFSKSNREDLYQVAKERFELKDLGEESENE